MRYQDEEIIKAKKQMEEEKKRRESQENLEKEGEESIYDEVVHIVGEEVKFERRVIPELKISIYMPDSFFRFTDEIKQMIYPSPNAPTFVFGGERINFQMSMNQTQHIVPDAGMKEFINISARLLEAAGPKVTIVEKKVKEKEGRHMGVMSFVSKAVDMMVYNVQYYISMDNKLLIGGITFPSKYKKRMIPLAEEIMDSLEIVKEEKEENGNNITS